MIKKTTNYKKGSRVVQKNTASRIGASKKHACFTWNHRQMMDDFRQKTEMVLAVHNKVFRLPTVVIP